MDFHTLSRRELQALCKKNKIPANMTNVAMADSLKALEIVEGIEEFLQTCESETAQSSIESPVRSEVTSPYVPPTGGRSTRRRNVAKEEPETAKPSARAQRTTRRTLVKYADVQQVDAIETPAVVPQTSRRKGQIASACGKMDSKLKECVEEEKKDVLVTPAATSRRRRGAKEESTVKRVYSTRRSVRLAEKNVEVLNEGINENPHLSKNDLFTDDCQEFKMNMKESSGDSDEVSGIAGAVDVEEHSEKKDETEVVSAEKQDISTVNEVEPVPTIEEEMSNHSEADGAKLELKGSSVVEIEEVGFGSEIEVEAEKEKCDKTEAPNDENKAQKNDGSLDVQTSEIEIKVEKIEQPNTDKDAGYEDQTVNFGENDVLESEDNFGIAEVSCEINIHNEIEKEISDDNELDSEDVTALNVNEEVLEINGSHDVQPSEIEIEVEKTEELSSDKGAGYEDEVAHCEENAGLESKEQNTDVENAGLESKDSACEDEVANCEENHVFENEVGEVFCDIDIHNEIEKDVSNDNDLDSDNVTDLNVNKEVLEINADVHEDSGEKKFNHDESDSVILEATEESTDAAYQSTDDSWAEMPFDISLMSEEDEASKWDAVFAYVSEKHDAVEEKDETNLVKDTEFEQQQSTEEVVLPVKELDNAAVEEPEEIDNIIQTQENEKVADQAQVPSEEASDCGEIVEEQLPSIKNSPSKQLEGGNLNADFLDQIPPSFAGLDSRVVQSTPSTPIRASASKASAKKKRTTAVSDNKENFGSGSKLVLTKGRVKMGKNTAKNGRKLDNMSVRQLTKMLKETLQITNKSSKNENDSEVVTARPALQALPENR